jgi:hypothetical protein
MFDGSCWNLLAEPELRSSNTVAIFTGPMSLDRIASGTLWVAKLLAEEPDALMRARPGLWEPWEGNDLVFTHVSRRILEGADFVIGCTDKS